MPTKIDNSAIFSKNCFTNIKSTNVLTQEKYVIVRTSFTMKISSFISFLPEIGVSPKAINFMLVEVSFLQLVKTMKINTIKIWRMLTGHKNLDIDYWLTRIENELY